MHDRRNDAASLFPRFAIADKQSVAEEGCQRVAHLRRFALKTIVQRNERLGHRIGAVAHEQPAAEDAGGKELIFETFLVEDGEKVAAGRLERRYWRQGLGRARRIRRHEARHRRSHLARTADQGQSWASRRGGASLSSCTRGAGRTSGAYIQASDRASDYRSADRGRSVRRPRDNSAGVGQMAGMGQNRKHPISTWASANRRKRTSGRCSRNSQI